MKRCPSCGYSNPDTVVKCSICARDISGLPSVPVAPVPKKADPMLVAGLILLACAALFYFSQYHGAGTGGAPSAVSGEESYSYAGVLYSLDKMAGQRYLPAADKLKVLPLLLSREENVACAAAKAVGVWSRSGADEALKRTMFENLLEAAVSARPAARRQAAFEAGFAVASGFSGGPYLDHIRRVSAGLAAEREPELRAAGFSLSSMAGLRDLMPQMRETLSPGPGLAARLCAACALSRLGDPEGGAYLAGLEGGAAAGLDEEALSCLSYSSSPAAARLLKKAANAPGAGTSAKSAKRALMLREQLAIIKK